MSWSKITLVGIEEWLNYDNKSVFDGLRLPEGIDLETLKANIMLQGGEFEVLYGNPDFMTSAISKWGLKWYRTFEKWVKALAIEYEPLYNYDRHEEWTDSGSSTSSLTGGNTRTDNLTRTNDLTQTNDLTVETEIDGDVTNTRSAFDADTYQPHDKSTTDSTETTDNTGTIKNTGTVKDTGTVTDAKTESSTGSTSGTHSGHIFGNIGVKTTQSMLLEELSVAEWNLYDHITDLFIKELTIPVYE